ncbi:MAG: TetR/AcrR family transcriptional regulator [Clostridiales bacterium]|nr:TetR/AcrR family transcriptional regulator [Clostridiales bacterium]
MITKYQKTHAKIIRTGMQLLFANDFDSVSVPMICKEAGISRPTFYSHFKCREQLVAEYYGSSFFLNQEKIQWISSAPDSWTSLIRMQLLHIRHTCNPDQAHLISQSLSYQLTEQQLETVKEYNGLHQEMLFDLIKKAQHDGFVLNRSDPHYLCKSVFMLQTGNLFLWCADNGRFDQFTNFFWNLEAVLCVNDACRGLWKSEVAFIPDFQQEDQSKGSSGTP